jgi:uncharacterized repeat protein (TIGR02543 family)
MREKTKALQGVFLLVLLCSAFCLAGRAAQAAETNEAFDRQTAVSLYEKGKLTASGQDVTLNYNEKADGIMISGDAQAFSETVFQYGDAFDFKQEQASYLIVDALAQRKKSIALEFYFDEESTPFATVNLAKQKKAEIWSTVKNRCANLDESKATGSHTLRFKVVTEEKGSVKLVFRAVTFLKSDIPTVDFQLDETQGTIAEMNGDSAHNTECYGQVTLRVPEGYQSEYSTKEFETQTYELDYIRGRGNSTWIANKKPYKFKLDKKQDLLGMGKNKHWVLLANYYDVSMLRNKITYWLGEKLGMEFTPQCEFVNVVMNGEYLGSYYLCEQVRVGESRVDIDDLEQDEASKNATDEETISGGYLLSMCPYGDEDGQQIWTEQGNNFLIESPSFEDYLNEAQLNYITDYVQKTENAIYGDDFKDESGVSYQEYMDIDSAVDYYWIQEISMNGDAFGSTSTYLYKKRNGKLYWGPLWDFDYVAWGATEYSGNQCTGFQQNNSTWFKRLFADPVFYQKVVDRWPAIKKQLLEACKDGGQIDIYSAKQYESQKHNYEIWTKYSDMFGNYWWEDRLANDGTTEVTYDSEVERFKEWIRQRVRWIDGNLDSLQKEYCTVTFQSEDMTITTMQVEKGSYLYDIPYPEEGKEGYTFAGWYYTQDGEELALGDSKKISEDITFTARWEKKKKTPQLQGLAFARQDFYMYYGDDMSLTYCTLPFDASADNLTWESSDEEVATVSDGYVYALKKGDAVITVTAENGATASCTVHAVDYQNYVELENISLAQKSLTIKAGEYAQIQEVLHPANATFYGSLTYASSDESIVKVNDCGYVYGVAEGTAVIAVYYYESGLQFCKVTVTKSGAVSKEGKKGTKFTAGGLRYQVTAVGKTKTVQCIGTTKKNSKTLVIPATVTYQKSKYRVTAVGGFSGCKKLTKVTLGKYVTTLKSKAFYGCSKLKKIVVKAKRLKKTGKNATKGTAKNFKIVTSS